MNKTVQVKDYTTGSTLGRIKMDAAEWEQYAACEHPAYQWPEGLARAGDVLDAEDLGVSEKTVIFLED